MYLNNFKVIPVEQWENFDVVTPQRFVAVAEDRYNVYLIGLYPCHQFYEFTGNKSERAVNRILVQLLNGKVVVVNWTDACLISAQQYGLNKYVSCINIGNALRTNTDVRNDLYDRFLQTAIRGSVTELDSWPVFVTCGNVIEENALTLWEGKGLVQVRQNIYTLKEGQKTVAVYALKSRDGRDIVVEVIIVRGGCHPTYQYHARDKKEAKKEFNETMEIVAAALRLAREYKKDAKKNSGEIRKEFKRLLSDSIKASVEAMKKRME